MTLELAELWDFRKPELSEQRFREALGQASDDEKLILYTQIARTYGLRGEFAQAQQVLAGIAPQVRDASAEARVRFSLEMGRTYAAATHDPAGITPADKEQARRSYLEAFELAKAAGLDGLAVDALHMMPFVDTAPEAQLEWNRRALDFALESSQADAQKWIAPLHNNTGYALHLLGKHEDALREFELALAAYQQGGDERKILVARWMVAWEYHALGRLNEALEIQIDLDRQWIQIGEADPYVLEELEKLYTELGEAEQAEIYAARRHEEAER